MNRSTSWMILLSALTGALAIGCRGFGIDAPPPAPRTAAGQSGMLTISDEPEQKLAAGVEAARVNYNYRLEVLQAHYDRIGNIDKYNWTVDEIKNLRNAQTFEWLGLPQIVPPSGEQVQDTGEPLLVEYLVKARKDYKVAVEELASLYERQGQSHKAATIRNMQDRLDPVRQHMYLLSAEIPPADRKPTKHIPAADDLYKRAVDMYEEGKGVFRTFISTDYDKERKALRMFRDLVDTYEDSTKIALAAFYIAEIYKEYFNENIRAVHWYERAWQWDPNIPKLARSQCAFIYDLRLHNKAKALECYRLAVKHETFDPGRVRQCARRIRELEASN